MPKLPSETYVVMLGKSSEISEDVQKQIEEEINKMTEKYCDKCDKLSDDKTKEIMTV